MLTLVEERVRRIGLHHQAFAGFIHAPPSCALAVPGPNSQSAIQYIEKLRKWVLMKWNTHARHDRGLKSAKGGAIVISQCPPQQLHRPDIQRRTSRFVALDHVVMNDFFKRCGEV